jgi:hypothetical protein
MGWDAENATRYAEVSASLGKLAARESDPQLKTLLLSMSADCGKLAGYFRASDETAGLSCAGVGITEERLKANREMNALLKSMQKQWELLAAELDKSKSAR